MPADNQIVLKKSISGSPDQEAVYQSIKKVMASHGYSLDSHTDDQLAFSAPPLNSTKRDSPLRAASNIQFTCRQSQIKVIANLNGLDRIRNLLIWLPIGLFLLFLTGLVVGGYFAGRGTDHGFGVPFASGWNWVWYSLMISFAPIAPWIFLSPYILMRSKWRCELELKHALSSIVASSY